MDLKEEILREHSKPHTLMVAAYIGDDQDRFDELVHLFLNEEYRVTQRAAWILSHCCNQYPSLIYPHLPQVITNLKTDPEVAIKRNTLRVLQYIEVPEDLMGELADYCFNYLTSAKEPVAVKAFAMTVLFNITKKFPELKEELGLAIEDQMPYGSKGFVARGRKILKSLKRMSATER